jgi:hypothetical protein
MLKSAWRLALPNAAADPKPQPLLVALPLPLFLSFHFRFCFRFAFRFRFSFPFRFRFRLSLSLPLPLPFPSRLGLGLGPPLQQLGHLSLSARVCSAPPSSLLWDYIGSKGTSLYDLRVAVLGLGFGEPLSGSVWKSWALLRDAFMVQLRRSPVMTCQPLSSSPARVSAIT